MRKTVKLLIVLFIGLSSAGWVNVHANLPKHTIIPVELELTNQSLSLGQNERFDPLSAVVTGVYDHIDIPLVDTSEVGPQTLVYKARKGHTEITKTLVLNVQDNIKPEFSDTIDYINIEFDEWIDLESYFSAFDEIDGELAVDIIGDFSTAEPGVYSLVARAVDESNNVIEHEFTLEVNELVIEEEIIEEPIYEEPVVQEVVVQPQAPIVNTPVEPQAPVVEQSPVVVEESAPAQDGFSVTMTRYGMDCYGCVVTDGVAYTSHGIALTADSVRQPDGSWLAGITYNGRYIVAGNRAHTKCTLISIYDHPYEGMGIIQGQPIHAIMADNGAFGYNHIDLFIGTETNVNAVWIANSAARPYAIITGFATFTGSGCSW